ncbi:MAG: class I SAM-dependent DNA methyltransferase [Trueperaceae bacterium]|nr:class I SAM-dependent DNA methyltransferase [Trueperaceae bacterium]
MNAVEIEEAVSALVEKPFDPSEFPYQFLMAYGNRETTIKRLRDGTTNKSDVGGLLQTNNIHILVAPKDGVPKALEALRSSPATARSKAKFLLATDGVDFQAEDLQSGATLVCDYEDFADHFGFFLPLAGISTVKEIRESSFDIKATGRLNRLYLELLKDNPEWGTSERRHDMNKFMARLIFSFFAEDTGIFPETRQFTSTVEQMSARDSSNTHEVIEALFLAMNTQQADRQAAGVPRWADGFPYVNGGLFSGSLSVPRFSRIARQYLLHIGSLDWTKINPDIFGSMIQAVAEDEERGSLGMHYTSVPNILKVLNPLFLDDLREKLEAAGDNPRSLLNLRKRIARMRVFDPACGSGNFLVIAYKELRAIEAEINRRRGEPNRRSEIPLTNFRGIEIRDFAAEIARLALVIAEYQCDVLYRGHKLAMAEFLPLSTENWITHGNALRLDWLSVCPPTGTKVQAKAVGLFDVEPDQTQIDFENEGGETYICGNPPYLGFTWQSPEQKADLELVFKGRVRQWRSLDYVAGWFLKAADYGTHTIADAAFVATNSVCQGQQVPILWPAILGTGHRIHFAHTSFRWANLASNNAGVTVAIIGLSASSEAPRRLYSVNDKGETNVQEVGNINAYLIGAPDVIVTPQGGVADARGQMVWGNKATDGGNLILSPNEKSDLLAESPSAARFIRRFVGSQEFIRNEFRYCLWIEDRAATEAAEVPEIARRIAGVANMRSESKAAETRPAASYPHRFRQIQGVAESHTIIVPSVSSESREYLPVGFMGREAIVSNLAFAIYDAPLWNLAIIASRLHLVWIASVCGKLETRYRYSNTLGWNTFPMPELTAKNKSDLTRCAEEILLAREAHFPATVADLYESEKMPANLRAAHERNDEVIERIFIGRRFRNDTERLERLFQLYAELQARSLPTPSSRSWTQA